jgi:uncharacterized protein YjiS (DUF1127 family)
LSRSSVLEPRRAGSGAGVSRTLLSNWARAVEIWLIRAHGRHELNSLDDRLLDDIGISREGALRKARQAIPEA